MVYTLLPFEPDWSSDVQVEREYKTDVIVSRNLTEQRKAARQQPRRAFEFETHLSPKDSKNLILWMGSKAQSLFAIPDFTRETELSSSALIAVSSISIPTPVPHWVRAGASLVIGSGRFAQKELLEIASVSGSTVNFTTLTTYAWPSGSKVRPAVLGTLDQQFKFSMATTRSGKVKFRFIEDPGAATEKYVSPPILFDGREVFLGKFNWRDSVTHEVEGQLATLAFELGVFSHVAFQDFNPRQVQGTYSMFSKAEAEEFIEFLHRKRGRLQPFWMPTWQEDMVAFSDSLSGTFALTVVGRNVFDLFEDSVSMNRVAVVMETGTIHFFTVSSVDLVGDNTRLTFVQALPEALGPSSISRIHWMPLWRFSADKSVLKWATDSIAETKLALTQLRSDALDDGFFSAQEIVADGAVSSATRTYSIVGLPFISTTAVKGDALFNWSVFVRDTISGLGKVATLQVTVRFFLDSGGSPGTQIGASIVRSVTATGQVDLQVREAIPSTAGHVRFILSRSVAVPANTAFETPINTVEIRGRP